MADRYPTLQQSHDHGAGTYSNEDIIRLIRSGNVTMLNTIINGPYYVVKGWAPGWFSDNKKDFQGQDAKYDFIVDECKRYNPGLVPSLHRNGHSGYSGYSGGSIPSQKTKTSARHLVNGKSYVVWKGPRGGLYYKTHDRFVRIK